MKTEVSLRQVLVLALLAVLGLAFLSLVSDYQPDAALNRSADYYASYAVDETGAQNIVAAIIVTYRGLDTLGEVTVLFLTAGIVALVLGEVSAADTRLHTPDRDSGELLATGTALLIPLIVTFAAYVLVNGHRTPGGGFQGGTILASAFLLSLLAEPGRRTGHALMSRIESLSGLVYVALGIAGLIWAGGFLDNRILPLGTAGELLSAGAIPLIYALIGLKVGAEFSSMLESLRQTGDTQ